MAEERGLEAVSRARMARGLPPLTGANLLPTIPEQPIQTRPCPTCDHLGHSDVLDQGPPLVVACTRCGMVFNDVAEDVDYSGGKYAEPTEWDKVRHAAAAERIFCDVGLERDATILDVGCGSGGLIEALSEYGYDRVVGIDPSQECADKSGAEVGTLSNVYPDEKYDCVILSHVLEHVRDTAAAMRKLEEVADSVYIEVPDGLRYGQHAKSPYQNWNAEHVNHFDLEHLNMLFHAHGFQLRMCGEYTCEPDKFPAIWAWFTKRASLRGRQEEYGRASANAMRRIKEQIKAIKGPVIAWGIGALARRLEPLLQDKVRLAIDANPITDGRFSGWLIGKPEWVGWKDFEWPIIVTTILHKDTVLADIKRLGLRNEVITL